MAKAKKVVKKKQSRPVSESAPESVKEKDDFYTVLKREFNEAQSKGPVCGATNIEVREVAKDAFDQGIKAALDASCKAFEALNG